ncbi:unnamed protein product [marine sediment metagenome]|uniref:5'-Nucleotidase C-terminal domain-containing protein n=1 Tax=marine sediment metagenome TaxID=412755 RepID=X1P891_9ZZZZ
MLVGGEPLDYEETYRVVTNDFLAGGQDGWVTFADGTNRWNTYYDMQEAVNEYIDLNSPITPTVEERIVYTAPAGPEGPAGPAGPAGPTGPAGPSGEPAPTEVVWGSIGIAIVALLAALYAVTKRK